jgi:hypothetical protein
MNGRRYLLDENVDPRLKRALLRHSPGMTVWCVGDSGTPPLETNDPEILSWCEKKAFTLVTNNRASMPVHLREHLEAGRHVPGIFILKRGMTMREIVNDLNLIWEVAESSEYADQIKYLPITF